MSFLVDAQLPPLLVDLFRHSGHDALHTTTLPHGNASTGEEATARADADDRVVVTKDIDVRDGHLLRHAPQRLLLVRTGNVTNSALLDHVNQHLGEIVDAFEEADLVELSLTRLIVYEREKQYHSGTQLVV